MAHQGVEYVKQDEPAFLKRFKEKVGYKEEPALDAKRQKLELDDHDDDALEDKDDEKPIVIVLQPGDLTAEEAETVHKEAGVAPPAVPSSDKIIFKKPLKKTSMEASNHADKPLSKEATVAGDAGGKNLKDITSARPHKKEYASKAIKNSSLLSFSDDDATT